MTPPSYLRPAALYAVMIAAAIGGVLVIRTWGEALPTVADAAPTSGTVLAQKVDVLPHVLLALVAVILAGRVVGRLFAYVGQPPVMGEVIAGILLGPSLLGRISPEAMTFILPPTVAPFLGVIAQLGIILYMFIIGLELDAGRLRAQAHAIVAIAHASIALPFVLGVALALGLFSSHAPAGVRFTSFALFMGVSLSVTAFPVLARILSDRGIARTELGIIALSCAAAGDATAWCLLAFVVGVVQAKVSGAVLVAGLSLAYLLGMILVVRPLARRLLSRYEEHTLTQSVLAGVLLALLGSALLAEAIGIHALFGAFVLGAVLPHDSAVARVLARRLEDLVTILLLPAFFALTGMRTEIGLLAGVENWLMCGAIILVATIGKFGGSFVAARLTGLDWRTSASLGVLMNTRGLMELIVLNIGLDLGVISPTLFAMMVVMALVTTLATTPLLQLIGSRSPAVPATLRVGESALDSAE